MRLLFDSLPPIFSELASATSLRFATLLAQDDAAQPDGGFLVQLLNNPLILPAAVIFIFYITFLGPERRRKAEEAKMMSAMKKNDRVITVGGIHGIIVSASPDSDVVTLKLDEGGNTRMKVNRSAIATIVSDKKSEKSNENDKESS